MKGFVVYWYIVYIHIRYIRAADKCAWCRKQRKTRRCATCAIFFLCHDCEVYFAPPPSPSLSCSFSPLCPSLLPHLLYLSICRLILLDVRPVLFSLFLFVLGFLSRLLARSLTLSLPHTMVRLVISTFALFCRALVGPDSIPCVEVLGFRWV